MILFDRVLEPVTVITDRHDSRAFTAALLASHDPAQGRITVHPTPATQAGAALAYDILAALGKPTDRFGGFRSKATANPWAVAASWTAALPVTRLVILRAHLLTPAAWQHLLRLREHTAVPLTVVLHRSRTPTASHALQQVPHHLIADLEHIHVLHPPAPYRPPSHRDPNRWITIQALRPSFDHPCPPACGCGLPHPRRPQQPAPATLRQVERRLASRTVHPHLAAALATAVFTAASESELASVRLLDYDPEHSTLVLHHPQQGPIARPQTLHTIPSWARPFLTAATHLLLTGTPRAGTGTLPLFRAPSYTTTSLTEFTNHCRLKPPQQTIPRRNLTSRQGTK